MPDAPAYLVYPFEWACAIFSSVLVAPAITIVDKAIVANASGRENLWLSIKNTSKSLFLNPAYFFKQPAFFMIWGVYGGTYVAANSTQAYCDRSDIDWQKPKFAASSAANVGLSLLKDKAYARMFGVVGNTNPLPLRSYAMFMSRDSLTVASSFNLPPVMSAYLQKEQGWSANTSDTVSQLTAPLVAQIFSVPLHLYGLDSYNYPNRTIQGRKDFIKQEYTKTLMARWARIFPAFGCGGVINYRLRKWGHKTLFPK